MSTQQHFDDKRFTVLLKKSQQQPLSPDFDDMLMEKIIQIPVAAPQYKNGTALKLGKRYLLLAIGFLIISVFFSAQYLSGYFPGLTQTFRLAANYIFFGGMVLMIPILLYLFDLFLHEKHTTKQLSALYGI
jgi:hypothetical protein